MRCQNCGHKVSANAKWCENCGSRLQNGTNASKDDAIDSAVDMAAQEADINNTDYINELELKFSDGVEDWNEATAAAPAAVQQNKKIDKVRDAAVFGASKGAQAKPQSGSSVMQKRTRDVQHEQRVRPAKRAESKKSDIGFIGHVKNFFETYGSKLIIICLLALIALLCIGIIYAIKANISSKNTKGVTVQPDPNKIGSYCIAVPAKEGTKLIFEDSSGHQTSSDVAKKGYVLYNVAAASLLPTEPIEGEVCHVKPKIYCVEGDGFPQLIEVDEVDIKVPAIDIKFNTPDRFESDNGIVSVDGSVPTSQLATTITVTLIRDGSPILVNEPVEVNEDGSFSFSQKLDRGEYVIDLTAKLGGHSIFRKNFNAVVTNVLTAEQIVVIPPTFVSRSRHEEDSIRVYGAVPKGSSIKVTSADPAFSLKSEPTIDESGNFTFEVDLPTPAQSYKFSIDATLPDGAEFSRALSVERPPKYDEYVPTVWAGKYEEMIKPLHVADKKGFMIKGTVSEILYAGDYLLAKMVLDSGETIEIEYHDHYSSATKLVAGARHTMFGYSLGNADSTEGLLRMFIWFVQD